MGKGKGERGTGGGGACNMICLSAYVLTGMESSALVASYLYSLPAWSGLAFLGFMGRANWLYTCG